MGYRVKSMLRILKIFSPEMQLVGSKARRRFQLCRGKRERSQKAYQRISISGNLPPLFRFAKQSVGAGKNEKQSQFR